MAEPADLVKCEDCPGTVNRAQQTLSNRRYGRSLCPACQERVAAGIKASTPGRDPEELSTQPQRQKLAILFHERGLSGLAEDAWLRRHFDKVSKKQLTVREASKAIEMLSAVPSIAELNGVLDYDSLGADG